MYTRNEKIFFQNDAILDVETHPSVYLIPCNDYPICQQLAAIKDADDVFVLTPSDVYSEGAKLIMKATNEGCSGVKIFVGRNGSIDRSATVDSNLCLEQIKDIRNWREKEKLIPN